MDRVYHKSSSFFRYWGKADPAYLREPKWHPLAYHCLDVAASGKVLLEAQPAWLEVLCRLSNLPSGAIAPWVIFLLSIHDVGKFADGFQSRSDWMMKLQGRTAHVPYDARHDTLGYELAMTRMPEWIARVDLGHRGGGLLRTWLAAVTGHHGKPPRSDVDRTLLLRNQFPADVLGDAANFVAEAAALLIPGGCPLPDSHNADGEASKRASWTLAGLAVAADWLGSNTKWFQYREPDLGLIEYWKQVALPSAQCAIRESGLASPGIAPFSGIRRLFDIEPTPLQSWADSMAIADGPQLFVLEELTGGGKTEAALTIAARLTAAGRGQGVYVALPTMATADAMFDRVRKGDVWKRFFLSEAPQLVLAHSADWLKLRLEEANRRDAGYGCDEEPSASRNCTAWFADSRKKALLADFGVGTIDQALLSVLPVRHQSLRLLGLSTKVLVVDEVHACDAYTGELLERLLQFHAALGGSAILLSATLPQAQRARYLKAFTSGAEFTSRTPKCTGYPLATHLHARGLVEQPVTARVEVSRRVNIDALLEEETVFQRLFDTVSRGACAVWVRNTVVDALDAWQKWNARHPDCRPATLFHARFALVDRLGIGESILRDFGPKSSPAMRAGRLVIATQVVEQSLDVDFDYMVTDLAPIDLVIQRAGRLQRHVRDADGNRLHEKEAHDGRGGARLAVFTPDPKGEVSRTWFSSLMPRAARVYADHVQIWLTICWLEKNRGFDLSIQAREMIETVYGDTAFEAMPEELRPLANNADGSRRADRSTARGTELVFDDGYNPTSLQWDDDADAPTRLGEKTVRIRLARIVEGELQPWAQRDPGVNWALSELTVPRRLVAKESDRSAKITEQARAGMADEGRYCLIIPLTPTDGTNWCGNAADLRGQEIKVIYSPIMGLSIEKGAEDEFDQ